MKTLNFTLLLLFFGINAIANTKEVPQCWSEGKDKIKDGGFMITALMDEISLSNFITVVQYNEKTKLFDYQKPDAKFGIYVQKLDVTAKARQQFPREHLKNEVEKELIDLTNLKGVYLDCQMIKKTRLN
jgi:hypothetical protein